MRKRVRLWCLVLLLLTPTGEAHAFWRWIHEMSGPGYWMGFDFIFPWSLASAPPLSVADVNDNVENLQSMKIDAVKLGRSFEELALDARHQLFLARYFNLPLTNLEAALNEEIKKNEDSSTALAVLPARGLAIASAAFLRDTQLTSEDLRDFPKLRRFLPRDRLVLFEDRGSLTDAALRLARANEIVKELNDATRLSLSEDHRRVIRRFGAGPVGAFGSKRTIPKLERDRQENESSLENLFFNLHLGAAMTFPNNVDLSTSSEQENDILWLSTYAALEYRFLESKSQNANLFVNGGVSGNYFAGATFVNFPRFSFRAQTGFRYKRVHVAFDTQYFTTAFRPEDFGARPESFEPHHWTWGISMGYEISKPVEPSVKRN